MEKIASLENEISDLESKPIGKKGKRKKKKELEKREEQIAKLKEQLSEAEVEFIESDDAINAENGTGVEVEASSFPFSWKTKVPESILVWLASAFAEPVGIKH